MKKTMFTTFEAVINKSNSFTGFLKLTPKSDGDLHISKQSNELRKELIKYLNEIDPGVLENQLDDNGKLK